MRNYELTFIVPSDVPDDELSTVIGQVQGWVEDAKGKLTNTDQWGRRRLAYNIGPYSEASYVTLAMEIEPQSTLELERNIKLSPRILRHLLIRLDEID